MYALALLAASVAFPSLALSTARMALPPEFETAAERIDFDGFGGFNKGNWRFAEADGTTYTGPFTRGETRLGVFDPLLVRNKASGSFSFVDPRSGRRLDATCDMRKVTVNVDIVTVDTRKMAYQCEFSGADVPAGARLVIGQAKRNGFKEKFLAKDLRRGEVTVFDQQLTIESVHQYRNSKFGSQPPVGYLLAAGDRTVAAVELTDVDPVLYLAGDLPEDLRRAVFATALSIAVFRDPANSALEPD